MKKNFKIIAKVWRWPASTNVSLGGPGDGGWHFVNIDKDVSKKIRDVYTKGFVYITAKIGKTSYDTALFPHKQSASYLLSINKKVRLKEDIWEGDLIKVSFKIRRVF